MERVARHEDPAVVRIPDVVGIAVIAVEPQPVLVAFDVEHVRVAIRVSNVQSAIRVTTSRGPNERTRS